MLLRSCLLIIDAQSQSGDGLSVIRLRIPGTTPEGVRQDLYGAEIPDLGPDDAAVFPFTAPRHSFQNANPATSGPQKADPHDRATVAKEAR
jgi:hypothetical protein